MSRRFLPPLPAMRLTSAVVGFALLASALLPLPVAAQRAVNIDVDWQLLRQLDEQRKMEPVPAGVGATLRLRAGTATIDGACSSYRTGYERRGAEGILFTVVPDDVEWRQCDEIARSFDETFYQNLAQVNAIAPLRPEASVMTFNDDVGQALMTLTRAKIESDPSAARWGIERLGGADGSTELVVDPSAWMEFLPGGSLVGNTGCGAFLGRYTVNVNAIDITDVASRFTACTEGVQQQAEQMLGMLGEVTSFVVRPAGLILNDAGGNMRFALVPPIESGAGAIGSSSSGSRIGGQIWTPVEVLDEDGVIVREGRHLSTTSVRFSGRGVDGRTICRWYKGNALRSGLAVMVDDIAFIGRPCEDTPSAPRDQVEFDFIDALEATSSYALRGSELELKDVAGNTRMRLRPQPPLVGPTWVARSMKTGKKLRPVLEDAAPTLEFEEVGGLLQGQTGTGNSYFGFYAPAEASRLVIDSDSIELDGRSCRSKKARATRDCKQEAKFLGLLKATTGYAVREDDLWLLGGPKGTDTIMTLDRQVAGGEE